MKDNHSPPAEVPSPDEAWTVDADASLQSVLEHPECPSLARDALTGVLSWQMRVETPVRRALASPRIAPQWVAALLALGATVTLGGADGSARMDFAPVLENGTARKVSALHIPVGSRERRCGYAAVARTPADAPIVAACAVVGVVGYKVRQARVALTGVWLEPVRLVRAPGLMVGGPLDESSIRAVAKAVEDEVEPIDDYLGSTEYRRAMAGVLTRRALEQCVHKEVGGR